MFIDKMIMQWVVLVFGLIALAASADDFIGKSVDNINDFLQLI